MALVLAKDNRITVIDRTLPEVMPKKSSLKRLEIIYFCWMLKDTGVDLIEIDIGILNLIGKLPAGIDFLLRIRSKEDIYKCMVQNIKNCILGQELIEEEEIINCLKSANINVILEVRIDKLGQIKRIKNLSNVSMINEIRLTGMDSFSSLLWIEKIKEVKKHIDIKINVCPQNLFYNATALCVEAIMNGIDSVTVSFLGHGKDNGYAALEEVLVAVKVLLKADLKIDLSKLPNITNYFASITGIPIADNKPIVGKSIFNYQAGIHADGIEKNPATYEPFDPSVVGLKRTLTIGKHSGKKAVQKKLEEMGIRCKLEDASRILKNIREKSTQCKRDLFDEEIVNIYMVTGTL